MTTTIPTTLSEYHEFVRKEALKIQRDMGWPDEKLNEALRNLGLPEKLSFSVPIEVTGRMFVVVKVDDTQSEAEARASIAQKTPEELRELVRGVMQTGYFGGLTAELLDEMPTDFVVGGPDITRANNSVNVAANDGVGWCEHYEGTNGRHYCTRERGHEGVHANGNGSTILAVWDRV